MAALLTFHLLGLYPVLASRQLLIGSPFVSGFNLSNNFFNTVTKFTVVNFDNTTLTSTPPDGSQLYVKSITINGEENGSLCWIDFEDVVGGGDIVIEVYGDTGAAGQIGCGAGPRALPDSLESGGFSS